MVPKDQHSLDQRAIEVFSSTLGKPLAMSLLEKECRKFGFGVDTLNENQLVVLIKDIEPLIDSMVGELLSHQIIAKLRELVIHSHRPLGFSEMMTDYTTHQRGA